MKYVITVLLILLLVTPAFASNYYHTVQIQVEGEYNFNVDTNLPDATVVMDFEGNGKAAVSSDLRILTQDLEELQKWWNLF